MINLHNSLSSYVCLDILYEMSSSYLPYRVTNFDLVLLLSGTGDCFHLGMQTIFLAVLVFLGDSLDVAFLLYSW